MASSQKVGAACRAQSKQGAGQCRCAPLVHRIVAASHGQTMISDGAERPGFRQLSPARRHHAARCELEQFIGSITIHAGSGLCECQALDSGGAFSLEMLEYAMLGGSCGHLRLLMCREEEDKESGEPEQPAGAGPSASGRCGGREPPEGTPRWAESQVPDRRRPGCRSPSRPTASRYKDRES